MYICPSQMLFLFLISTLNQNILFEANSQIDISSRTNELSSWFTELSRGTGTHILVNNQSIIQFTSPLTPILGQISAMNATGSGSIPSK